MITNSPDTLSLDSTVINAWRADDDYAYGRELVQSDFSVIDWISQQLGKLAQKLFSSHLYQTYGDIIWIIVGVTIVMLLIWFFYYKRPQIFKRNKEIKEVVEEEQDTIYGIDFEKEINEALKHKDYRQALRMIYLQTLKALSDGQKIDWQLYKTPTQYTYEIRTEEFRKLTHHFLRVRYGNFDATADMCAEMQTLRDEIRKGEGV